MKFLFFVLTLFLMSASLSTSRADRLPLYIGTYTKDATQGVNLTYFDTQTGELAQPTVAAATASPTFLALHPNQKFLYAVNENGEVAGQKIGGLSAFEIGENNSLKPLNAVAAGGGLCHLRIDATGKYLLAAAYGGGSVEVWSLKPNGEIGERIEFIQHPTETDPDGKPNKPHGHQFELSPDNRFAFAVDLGLDKIFIHHFDAAAGKLTPAEPAFVKVAPGAGPRHLTFDSNAAFAYLINEHGNTINAFKYHEGTLEEIQTISTLPENFEGKNYTAEIAVHPNGRFLYGSNRRRDSIVVYRIAQNGTLSLIGEAFTEGRNPRHFTLSPDGKWLLAANQNDNSIIVFRLNPETGLLTKASLIKDIPGDPVCLLWAPSTPAQE